MREIRCACPPVKQRQFVVYCCPAGNPNGNRGRSRSALFLPCSPLSSCRMNAGEPRFEFKKGANYEANQRSPRTRKCYKTSMARMVIASPIYDPRRILTVGGLPIVQYIPGAMRQPIRLCCPRIATSKGVEQALGAAIHSCKSPSGPVALQAHLFLARD